MKRLVTPQELDQLLKKHKTKTKIAEVLGLHRASVQDLFRQKESGLPAYTSAPPTEFSPQISEEIAENPEPIEELQARIKTLEKILSTRQAEDLTREMVRREIFKLRDYTPDPPGWLVRSKVKGGGVRGAPFLFASDWQWGEVIQASELNGFNAFDSEIAHARARTMIEKAIRLLDTEFQNPKYEGIVFLLGGDMVSGDIHDELTQTNAEKTMPTVLTLLDVLVWCIDSLVSHFGRVHVPCVPGNHGRTTKKPPSKERAVTNWDWLIGQLLERHYRDDKRVSFQVESSPDCYFKVYDIRYCLTHGDHFRSGDSMIGPLGPITRGRIKKANRDILLNQAFDVMLCGHFHWLMMFDHLVVNGCLPGYSEFAYLNNMTPTRAGQACWIQHPEEGITHWLPIYVDERKGTKEKEWVSLPK